MTQDKREKEIDSHTAIIICPECETSQPATVLHTFPYFSYVHTCVKCGYVIMESEWNEREVRYNFTI